MAEMTREVVAEGTLLTLQEASQLPSGKIVAAGVSVEQYLEQYSDGRYEYVRGYVIEMATVSTGHNNLTNYLVLLFSSYFAYRPLGVFHTDPVKLLLPNGNWRLPDVMLVLNDGPGRVTPGAVEGGADICIEVVSPGSKTVDYTDKLEDYEAAGVREYWIFDQKRHDSLFYRLNSEGIYERVEAENGVYITPLLPGFRLVIGVLWQAPLPNVLQVIEQIRLMLGEG